MGWGRFFVFFGHDTDVFFLKRRSSPKTKNPQTNNYTIIFEKPIPRHWRQLNCNWSHLRWGIKNKNIQPTPSRFWTLDSSSNKKYEAKNGPSLLSRFLWSFGGESSQLLLMKKGAKLPTFSSVGYGKRHPPKKVTWNGKNLQNTLAGCKKTQEKRWFFFWRPWSVILDKVWPKFLPVMVGFMNLSLFSEETERKNISRATIPSTAALEIKSFGWLGKSPCSIGNTSFIHGGCSSDRHVSFREGNRNQQKKHQKGQPSI